MEATTMAIDWSLVVAAGVGAAIGLLGQWLGSLGSRRHADEMDHRLLEHSRQEHERVAAEQREASLRDRERLAVEAIIRAFQEGQVGLLLSDSDTDARGRRAKIVNVVTFERIFVRDPGLRYRLGQASAVIEDLGYFANRLSTTRASVHWMVRIAVLRWLGAFLRGEPFPEDSEGWLRLTGEFDAYGEQLVATYMEKGVNVPDWRFTHEMY